MRLAAPALLTAAGLFGLQTPAEAGFIVYDDKDAFLSATGAADASGPYTGNGNSAGPRTFGGVTLSTTPGSVLNFKNWTNRLPGIDLAISGVENLNVALAGPVFALGFDFVEPQGDPNVNATFVDSTFTVSLFDGATLVNSFTFSRPNDVAAFVGVWGSRAFTRAEIRETVGGAENEFFGRFYTGDEAMPDPAHVFPNPEPSSLLLLGTGAIGLAGFLRRRRAAA